MNSKPERTFAGALALALPLAFLCFNPGCTSNADPGNPQPQPTFNVNTVAADVELAATIATSAALSQETDPVKKTKLAEEMYMLAHAVDEAIRTQGTDLHEITALVNAAVEKNTDNRARAAAGLLVNALSLAIQDQLGRHANDIAASDRAKDAIRLVSAACHGVEGITSSYVNPSTPVPTLSVLAGR